MNLTYDMQELYMENYETLKIYESKDLNQWSDPNIHVSEDSIKYKCQCSQNSNENLNLFVKINTIL